MTLTSENNPLLKQVRRAVSNGSLTEDGFAIAEGIHLLEEALKSRVEIECVLVSESLSDAVERRLDSNGIRFITVGDRVFNHLASTETPQGVITLVRPREWTLSQLFENCAMAVILDGIQDPGNAGAIVRAAEAFGATGTVFMKGSVNPFNPKCLRGSAGSIFRVPFVAPCNVEDLPNHVVLYAAMPHAELAASHGNFKQSCAIIIGSEGRGISDALAARATGLRIPTMGVESLNAAVAAGILLYEARRQRDSL